MGEEPIDATADRRTFLSGLLGLNVGSFLPRQWWFGVEERVHVKSVRPDVYPAGRLNPYTAIAVGDDVVTGLNERADSTLPMVLINGEFGPTDDPDHESAPSVSADVLAHHPDAGYYAAGETGLEGPPVSHVTYLRQWRPESDSSWVTPISVFDTEGYSSEIIPRAMETTDDGGVVVAGEARFWEQDEPEDDDEETATGDSEQPSTPTPAETTVADQEELPLPDLEYDLDGRKDASWIAKCSPTGDIEWTFGGRGEFECLTASTDRPRLLVSTERKLFQLSFDESGAVADVDVNEEYGSFGGHDYVSGAFDYVGDTYRCVVDMGEPTPDFLQFDDDLNLVDQTRAALLSKPKGQFLFADEDGYLFRRTGSKLGIERPVIEKYGLDGRPRWSHAPTAFDGGPGIIKRDDGYGLIGPRDGRIRYAVLAEGAPIQFLALLVTAAIGIKQIASGVRGRGDDDD